MATEDLYSILGVSKGASEGEIKKAYRKLARDLHPDRHKGDKAKEERFKRVSQAYQILSDKKRRALYDEFGLAGLRDGFDPNAARQYKNWGAATGGSGGRAAQEVDLEDLFGNGFADFFRQANRKARRQRQSRPEPPRRGGDFESEVRLDFADSIRGCEREFTFQMPDGNRTLRVKIPPGVKDGGKIRLKGQGRTVDRGEAGDLILTVNVRSHPYFWREENDLHLTLPITPAEAFEGAQVEIPTIAGKVTLRVPAQSKGGAKLRLRGKGVRVKGEDGDLIVHLTIVLPEGDSKRVSEIVRELENEFRTKPRADLSL